jgi:hypothetical protein
MNRRNFLKAVPAVAALPLLQNNESNEDAICWNTGSSQGELTKEFLNDVIDTIRETPTRKTIVLSPGWYNFYKTQGII